MMTRAVHLKLQAAALTLLAVLCSVHGHGFMVNPKGRNVVMWGTSNSYAAAGNGVGSPYGPAGRTGPCGDPYQDTNSNFAASATAIQATYTPGQVITTEVWISVAHGGRMGFSVCPRTTSLDQACFDANPLTLASGSGAGGQWYYILSQDHTPSLANPVKYTMQWQLPAGFSCDGGCTLQWSWFTYNSCVDPCPQSVCGVYALGQNPITGQTGPLAPCTNPPTAEVFRNCADIRITGSTTIGPAPMPTPPAPVPQPAPQSAPQPAPQPAPSGTCPTPTAVCQANPGQTYLANPYACDNTCNSFIQCSNGVGYKQSCAAGLRWNAKAMVCDWATNVVCPN